MPRGSGKAKFYGVARGREPGVYRTWDEASAQVTGIKGAVHKSFGTEAEAAAWVAAQLGGAVGDARPSESALLRSPATSPTPSRARPSSSARAKGPTSPPPERRAMSTIAGLGDGGDDAERASDSREASASPKKRYLLAFDGACRGNPGPSGAGALIKEDAGDAGGAVIFELATYLGDALTNNESEYLALIAGLRKASEMGCDDLRVIGDSKLVINQVNGAWQVKKPHLVPLFREARAVISSAPFAERFSMTHVERERNAEADALANAAVAIGRSRGEGVNVADARDDAVATEPTEPRADAAGFRGGGGSLGGSRADERRARADDGFFPRRDASDATRGFASSRAARFAAPARPDADGGRAGASPALGVTPGRKRAFPSVSSLPSPFATMERRAETAAKKRPSAEPRDPSDPAPRAAAAAAAAAARGDRSKNATAFIPAPDPTMFASLTVSRMRRAEVKRLAPGLLRAARFFA